MGFFDIFKTKKSVPNKDLDIGEPNDFENEVKDYWAIKSVGVFYKKL